MKNFLSVFLLNVLAISVHAQSTAYEVGHTTGYFIGRTLPFLIAAIALIFIYRYVNHKKTKS